MGVYLPTGAVGNGQVLCTFGAAGEVMAFFYPNVDFAQNVRQLLPALYIGEPGHGRLLWTFDAEFERKQEYLPRAKVLVTSLYLPAAELRLTFTDFCPPGEPALIRRVRVETEGERPFTGSFMKYFELRVNEVTGKQSVSFMQTEGTAVQYCRDIAIAVGGERPSMWRCGKSIDEGQRSAKNDMFDGHLNGQSEDIGQVDFALGWHLKLRPRDVREFDIIIAASSTRARAAAKTAELAKSGPAQLQAATVADDTAWLGRHKQPKVSPTYHEAYDRALLSIRMLQDEQTAAIIAAPEFDPSYELCGGYGYCWPRDATEAVEALDDAGNSIARRRLCDWYMKAQLPNGQWGQRYWTNADMASSWSLREDFMQVDQTAAALIAICRDVLIRGAEGGVKILETRWPKIRKGADALAVMVMDDGWHSYACDLWETFCGTFVYTNAGIHSALYEAARVADAMNQPKIAEQWREKCAQMKQAVIAAHTGEYFPRGVSGGGASDHIVDSSTLGVSEPFRMLSPSVPAERELIRLNLDMIEKRLQYQLPDGGIGIRRYEGDGYLGGVIGCVNTLWFALVNLQVATTYLGEDDDRAARLVNRATGYIDFCLSHGTPTGLLPELIGIYADYPYWAVPHGWASGLMVKCVLELAKHES